MDLSICIATLNARQYLQNCLDSLSKFPPQLEYEIIVVDNASTDDTAAMLKERYPSVTLIQNTKNWGFAHPINQALHQACGDFLLILNPDTQFLEDVATPQIAYLSAHPQVGLCIPKVLNKDGSFQRQSRRGEARPAEVFGYFLKLGLLFPRSRALNGYLQAWLPEDEIAEVKAVSGSCMFIRRECWQSVGDFDEAYFAYQEDSDYCFRARLAGWKVMYIPLTRIIHFGGEGGSSTQSVKSIVAWHKSYFIYYRKFLAKDYFFLFNLFYYICMLAKLIFALIQHFFRQLA